MTQGADSGPLFSSNKKYGFLLLGGLSVPGSTMFHHVPPCSNDLLFEPGGTVRHASAGWLTLGNGLTTDNWDKEALGLSMDDHSAGADGTGCVVMVMVGLGTWERGYTRSTLRPLRMK